MSILKGDPNHELQSLRDTKAMTQPARDATKQRTPRTDAFIADCEAREVSIWDALEAIQDHARQIECELADAQLAVSMTRIILAGEDHGSLPNDFPVDGMAAERMKDLLNTRRELATIQSAIPKPSKILTAEINDGVLSVSIGLDTLAFALQAGPRWPQDVEIMDAATFGKDVLRALEHEEEDGTTLVHRIFDRAGMEAMEQGSEGCRERS